MIKASKTVRVIVIVLLISMIFRFCFALNHLNHECSHDDNCPICLLIYKLNSDLNGFNPNSTSMIIVILMIIISIIFLINNNPIDRKKYTLIGLKVELIN